MFEQPGNKLKNFANFIMVINILAALVVAIIVGLRRNDFNFWPFIGILVIGFVASYVECLFLYAFGELVHSTEVTADQTRRTAEALENIGKELKRISASEDASEESAPKDEGAQPKPGDPAPKPGDAGPAPKPPTPAPKAPTPAPSAPTPAPSAPTPAPSAPAPKAPAPAPSAPYGAYAAPAAKPPEAAATPRANPQPPVRSQPAPYGAYAAPAPVQTPPVQRAAPQPAAWDPKGKTLNEHLRYALQFPSDEGMQRYLRSVAMSQDNALQPEEQVLLQSLCGASLQSLRAAVTQVLRDRDAAQ